MGGARDFSSRRGTRRALVVAAAAACWGALAGSAQAATIGVPCGDVAALRAAITTANTTPSSDTIEVVGGPCTFTLSTSVSTASGGIGLPIVTAPLVVEGHGATIERSTAAGTLDFRIFFANSTSLALRQVTVKQGRLSGANSGAGIAGFAASLALDQVTVSNNTAAGGQGGGIYAVGGSLDLHNSVVAFNQAATAGGIGSDQATVSVRRSLLLSNVATASAGAAYVEGGTAIFENDTFAGNVAPNGVAGLVLANAGAASGAASVRFSTFFNNRKTGTNAPATALYRFVTSGGGSASLDVTGTIVADDSAATATSAPCLQVTNGGGNVEWPGASCGFGATGNPRLGPLVPVPGGASVLPLLPGSAAIDRAGATCPSSDQRGAPRPSGDACDAGAYEAQMPDTFATGPASPTNDPAVTFSSDVAGATFECKLDAGSFSACTSPFRPVTGDGTHAVQVRAVSGGFPDATPASVTFVVDKTAPVAVATATVGGLPYVTGTWTSGDVVVHVTCDDPSASAAPDRVLSTEGASQSATLTCTDTAGNVGSVTVANVNIDKTAPTGVVTSTYAFGTWTKDAVVLVFQCDDGVSGIPVQPTDVVVSSEGADQHRSADCVDAAGNSAAVVSPAIFIDRTAPTLTANAGSYAAGSWTTAGVTVTFNCDGTGSPVASLTSPVVLTAEAGNATVSGDCADAAGNTATVSFGPVNIDRTAPTVVWGAHPASYNASDLVEITCTATDVTSGVASTTCHDVAALASSFGAGTHTLTATATDRAGNTFTATTAFTVTGYDGASLCALSKTLLTNGFAAIPMCVTLRLVDAATAQNKPKVKAALVQAYIAEVQIAQRLRLLSAADAARLIAIARTL